MHFNKMRIGSVKFVWMVAFLTTANGCGRQDNAIQALEARVQKLEAAAPGVGSTMSAVQMHFAKLYFAGQVQNWGLAEFELHEVEENLEKAVALRPEEKGVNLVNLTDAFKRTQLTALRQAIENKNTHAFEGAYNEAIAVCNGCHEETARPFLVITLPTAPPVTNQLWLAPDTSAQAGDVR
jgi:hypothetical protein